MMHLIWEHDLTSEEDASTKRSIKEHLLECYRKVYLCSADAKKHVKEQALEIGGNLIRLVSKLTAAEYTSLEAILSAMVSKGWIDELIVNALYANFSVQSCILLSMLAKSMPVAVVERKLDILLRQGLSADPSIALYTCIAIKSLPTPRLPPDNLLCERLSNFIVQNCNGPQW